MAPQLKKFCGITKYIEKTDPKLYEILDDLCLTLSFRPRRDHAGITFLWPAKATIAALDKMRYTDDIDKACDIMLAHIVHDYLPNTAAWAAKRSDIPNGLNHRLEVRDIKGAVVTLADGAELKQDEAFRTWGRRAANQAVWCVVKGELNHAKHVVAATFEHARLDRAAAARPKTSARGGGHTQRQILRNAAHDVCRSVLAQRSNSDERVCSGTFSWLVGFHKYVAAHGKDEERAQLDVLMSPLPLSTLAFIMRDDGAADRTGANCLRKLVEAYEAEKQPSPMDGMQSYLALVAAAHAALRAKAGVRGGALSEREAIDVRLVAVIDAAKKACSDVLKSSAAGMGLCADVLLALNLARKLELEMLERVSASTMDAIDLDEDVMTITSIIADRANGRCTSAASDTQRLGTLVQCVLQQVQDFVKSEYLSYPFAHDSKALGARLASAAALVWKDGSYGTEVFKLSPEERALLMSKIHEADAAHAAAAQ